MSSTYNVGDLVAEFLALCGVTGGFGVVSVHNVPMLDAIGRRNQIRFMPTRGETGASHMADGYARASGELGLLVSSTGPGAANAVPGIVEARFAGTPMLHLTGAVPTTVAGRDAGSVHDAPGQMAMLAAISKAAFRADRPQAVLGTLTRAAVTALTPPTGPVSVEIPIDVQRAPIGRPAAFDRFSLPLPASLRPATAAVEELAARVRAAKRPMIWAGRGARNAGPAIRALLDRGLGLVTSWAGRGVVSEDHPQNLGALSGNGLDAIEAFYDTVDLLIVAGSRLRGHETGDFSIRLPASRIQIDTDPLADGRSYTTELFVSGDVGLTLAALLDRLGDEYAAEPDFPAEIAALKATVQAQVRASLGPYSGFAVALREVMPADAIWARDLTMGHTTWGTRLMPIHDPRCSIYPVGAGIGQGLCLGIGAAAAAGRRKTVILTGDGGFVFNMGELWTAIQERLDVTVIVMNDGGYGVIKNIQDNVAGGRHLFAELAMPPLDELCRLARIPYGRVEHPDEFGPAAAASIAVDGPSLLEVDMVAIGRMPPYYPYGERIR